ncbi:MAG: response regulator [Bryobacterales bacterium]|nr:response regulator [Bryobacterales bacterium]
MSRRLVLVVEDSSELAANLEITLQSIADTEVLVAAGVRQARARLATVAPEDLLIIVTDIQLPDNDGLAWIRELRRSERFAATPIVVTSGETDPQLAPALGELGVGAFFRKPFSPLRLRAHVEALLGGETTKLRVVPK